MHKTLHPRDDVTRKATLWTFQATNKRNLTQKIDMAKNLKP